MNKRATPKPTDASAYFFQQLLPTERSDTPDTEGGTCNDAGLQQAAAAVLRSAFMPAEATTLLKCSTEEESCTADELAGILEASWKRVEEVMERNKVRRRRIEEELPQALAQVDAYTFWTPDSVSTRYDLPASKLCGSLVSEVTEDDDTAAAAATAAPGKHHAKAWGRTDRDLLNPARCPNCLRRLFAPILQRRDELPKSLTLLFNALQRVQSGTFPQIEAVIEKGFFELPLYRPFRCISSFITRYLAEDLKGEKRGQAFAGVYKLVSGKLKDAQEKLRQFGHNRAVSASPSPREGAAELLYGTLLTELRERKSLHDGCTCDLQDLTDVATEQLTGMERGLQECDSESRRLLSEIKQDAEEYVAGLEATTERRKAVMEEVNAAYQRDHDRLFASLQAKQYRAKKSEELQEKLARRVREATKEWYVEQLKYDGLAQEIITESVTLQQLDHSYKQLKGVLDEWATSIDSEEKAQWVTDVLQQSEEVRAHLITQCQQHIGRLKTEEHYRRCRLAGYATENALSWSRCLQDLAAIYESHYDTLAEKCNTSMQLRYLLSYEKDHVVRDLHQLQCEIMQLDAKWGELTPVLEELDMPVPALTQCESDAACQEFRRILCGLDSSRLIRGECARLAPLQREAQTNVPVEKDSNKVAGAG
ncbi:hypothetical protein DQ04_02361050 [Trypanosoma grayi]|uniref:hypothetical protein n=1 Tax=Trypanosoma grayi TaxID=71804 RepID=UPI0004F47862|nr:hypothetical protein DQ04_02361050 [Trypanosoma grayi]KEG11693.1 hypothetical protein DQ04_02361050 [Trypanosoma grayi]